jgi:hypothetical protein
MPFYLNNLTGGLGNQIFSVVTAYSLAKKYNTSYFINENQEYIPILQIKCPNYLRSVMNSFLEISYMQDTSIPNMMSAYHHMCTQFKDIEFPSDIDVQNNLVVLHGLPMKYSIFSDYLEDIADLFYKQKNKIMPKSEKIRIGIMFRTFDEENTPQYRVYEEYYENALKIFLQKYSDQINNLELHVYTDKAGVSENIILPILNKYNINIPYFENVGKRDQFTDVKHFFDMFDLDDYILCNSTFHYWSALLSRYNENKTVIYPTKQIDGGGHWFSHITPLEWVCI